MADEAIIDTHVHFWDHDVAGLEWAWLKPGFTFRRWEASTSLDAARFSVPEYRQESAGSGIVAVVHGHCADPIEDPATETAWLESLAERHGTPEAIVGRCSLADPDAVGLLSRHARYSRFRGVRDHGAMKHLDGDEIAPAMDAIADRGLSVEVRRDHSDLAVLHEVAARWPTVTVALSHACLPLERTRPQLSEWTAAMRRLAERPNVVCKISAVAGASDPDWTIESIGPWILGCVEVFGPDRCMLGSNWPVDRQFSSFARLIDAYRQVLIALDAYERVAVYSGTARRVYRIAAGTAGSAESPAAEVPGVEGAG